MESLIGSNVNIQELYNVEETIHFTNLTKLKSELNTISDKVRERDSVSDHIILVTGFPDDNLLTTTKTIVHIHYIKPKNFSSRN
jgi:hypothetical protein